MFTSILALALSAAAPCAEPAPPLTWLTDYRVASQQSAAASRPMAVVLAAGANGWEKLGKEGGLSTEAKALLASKYVCVHIDTTSKAGKELARKFEMSRGFGIVISSRDGKLQAFRHEGELTNAALVRYLKRYGDPGYVVHTTESNPGPDGHIQPAAPAVIVPGCPSCSGCYGGRCR